MSSTSTVAWQRNVPAAVRRHDSFDHHDYADVFTAITPAASQRSPEEWVRLMLDDPSLGVRAVVLIAAVAQRLFLGFPLEAPGGQRHQPHSSIFGWRITARGHDWIRLEAASRLMSGHLVLQCGDERLSLATFVRYERRLARLIWPPVSLLHRQVGLFLMRHAVRAAA